MSCYLIAIERIWFLKHGQIVFKRSVFECISSSLLHSSVPSPRLSLMRKQTAAKGKGPQFEIEGGVGGDEPLFQWPACLRKSVEKASFRRSQPGRPHCSDLGAAREARPHMGPICAERALRSVVVSTSASTSC